MSLRTPLAIAPAPTWEPKSGFFKHVMKKIRRPTVVQQAPREHNARLAFCTFHNSAYLSGDEFPKSPCCDTEPLLTYDLEGLADMASVVETLVEALQASDPQDLLNRIEVLAELVRVKVAGAADELSQEPSTAAVSQSASSEQDGPGTSPVASVEGASEAGAGGPSPADVNGTAGGETEAPASPAAPAKRTRSKAQPAAVPA